MAIPALKSLIAATVGVVTSSGLLTSGEPAKAALLIYDFQVVVNQGTYAGTHKGFFSFDSSKLFSCLEDSPEILCANPVQSNLRLNFNFFGSTYTEEDDIDYSADAAEFPSLYYSPDYVAVGLNPFQLSFIVNAPTAPINFAIYFDSFYGGYTGMYPDVGQGSPDRIGTVRYALRPPTSPGKPPGSTPGCQPGNCAAIPEPSEVAGTAAAVLGIGWLWRWRRKQANLQKSNFEK